MFMRARAISQNRKQKPDLVFRLCGLARFRRRFLQRNQRLLEFPVLISCSALFARSNSSEPPVNPTKRAPSNRNPLHFVSTRSRAARFSCASWLSGFSFNASSSSLFASENFPN